MVKIFNPSALNPAKLKVFKKADLTEIWKEACFSQVQ